MFKKFFDRYNRDKFTIQFADGCAICGGRYYIFDHPFPHRIFEKSEHGLIAHLSKKRRYTVLRIFKYETSELSKIYPESYL